MSFKSLISDSLSVSLGRVAISAPINKEVNTANRVWLSFVGESFFDNKHDFSILFIIYGRGWLPPSFSTPAVTFYVSRFVLQSISMNCQERITLSSVSDKQLM